MLPLLQPGRRNRTSSSSSKLWKSIFKSLVVRNDFLQPTMNLKCVGILNIATRLFLNPNHDSCVTETGYLADKAGPTAPYGEYSIMGSWLTGGAILHWPTANEFHNSVPAQFATRLLTEDDRDQILKVLLVYELVNIFCFLVVRIIFFPCY